MPRVLKLAVVTIIGAALAGCSSGPLADSTTTITARFENVNGLYNGNAVSVLGMRVGKIVDIRTRGSHVEVTMEIDGSTRIPADVQAVTVIDSILTDRHVELTPVYRGGPTLPDHAVLDSDHTKVPVEFDSVLEMADKLSESLEGDGAGNGPVADLMNVGAAATSGNGDGMRAALSELSKAMQLGGDHGAATGEAITEVVANLDELTQVAARNDRTLREFGTGIRQLSDILADQNLGSGDTGAKLNRILIEVTDLMTKNRANLMNMASDARVVTTSMADYDSQLAEFLDVFPLVIDNAYNAIDHDTAMVRATVDVNKALLDGQMLKEVCNLLNLKQLGCATGSMKDMGPEFGITAMLASMAGLPTQ